ncbi:MAG TPA: DUF4199 domain-containing protein [Chitinophagales bacterium]|nr:DUF4199 domain-containing protein [Chitinophagales bacterium]
MKRPAKKFALGTLAVSVIWILFEHLMGYNTTRNDVGQYTRLFPVIFFWIMLVVAIYYRRRGNGNTLTFSEGFRTGLIMTLIYCAGFTIVIILYNQYLNPEYYPMLKDFTMKQLQERQASQTTIDAKMKELEMTQSGTPLSYLLLFVFSSVWGIGISALASLILMKKPKVA